jgi:GH35 family endo-1,4-beta-xylanase
MGFSWVQQDLGWSAVQPTRDAFDWCAADRIVAQVEAKGLQLLFTLGQPPDWAAAPDTGGLPPAAAFGQFCGTVAERYGGRVRAYQVWNTPNDTLSWAGAEPNPARYVALLKAC